MNFSKFTYSWNQLLRIFFFYIFVPRGHIGIATILRTQDYVFWDTLVFIHKETINQDVWVCLRRCNLSIIHHLCKIILATAFRLGIGKSFLWTFGNHLVMRNYILFLTLRKHSFWYGSLRTGIHFYLGIGNLFLLTFGTFVKPKGVANWHCTLDISFDIWYHKKRKRIDYSPAIKQWENYVVLYIWFKVVYF